ncbi:hypothetical protein PENTCL1PPCAC_21272, partial [Pristionchus entomophagus]
LYSEWEIKRVAFLLVGSILTVLVTVSIPALVNAGDVIGTQIEALTTFGRICEVTVTQSVGSGGSSRESYGGTALLLFSTDSLHCLVHLQIDQMANLLDTA